MKREEAIAAIAALGDSMKSGAEWQESIIQASIKNQWFTPDFVKNALQEWSNILTVEQLEQFVKPYSYAIHPRKVGIVMAGNIPLVGLHDLICVLLAGHEPQVKCSKDDVVLMKKVVSILTQHGINCIEIVERIQSSEAVIATGSNNTARYFEYYFRNSPHLIRHNRTSVAILTENDDADTYRNLAKDVFMYFGLGCRNVGKIFIPRNFYLPSLLDEWQSWAFMADHNKFANNYIYHRALFLMNQQDHLDNGFLLLKEDESLFSPLGCLYYERYDNIEEVINKLEIDTDNIQCIVTSAEIVNNRVAPGTSQSPSLNEFADQIDTMHFLVQLHGG